VAQHFTAQLISRGPVNFSARYQLTSAAHPASLLLCLADRWDPAVIFLLRPRPGRTRPRRPCLRAGRAPAPHSSLGPACQGLPLPIKAAAACAALFFPNPSYPRRRPNLRTLAALPAAPASCAPPPSSSVRPLRCPRWVRRGTCFALVPPASQIVPGSAGSTCASEVAVERRRLPRRSRSSR
jgi:hypothetical protein